MNVLQRETQLLGSLDKAHASYRVVTIDPVAARGPRRLWYQCLGLIEPYRFHRHTGFLGNLAYP